jgi:hypothetical protein
MALVIDEQNPCEAARELRAVYYQLIAGQAAQVVMFKAGASGVERSATFHKADPSRLLQVIRGFEEQCAAAQGGRVRRFALRGGGL